MVTRNPGEVAAENIDRDRRSQEECANPEAPVTMHAPPIRTGSGSPMSLLFPSGLCLFPVISSPSQRCIRRVVPPDCIAPDEGAPAAQSGHSRLARAMPPTQAAG